MCKWNEIENYFNGSCCIGCIVILRRGCCFCNCVAGDQHVMVGGGQLPRLNFNTRNPMIIILAGFEHKLWTLLALIVVVRAHSLFLAAAFFSGQYDHLANKIKWYAQKQKSIARSVRINTKCVWFDILWQIHL